MPFLMNDVIVEPSARATPVANPDFPLSGAAFAALSLSDIAHLARGEFAADGDFPRTKPHVAGNLAGLVLAKTPANAMRIAIVDPAQGVDGVKVDFANLSLELMADLTARQTAGDLNMTYVNWMVWSAVDAA